jgi:hypothetical protein
MISVALNLRFDLGRFFLGAGLLILSPFIQLTVNTFTPNKTRS